MNPTLSTLLLALSATIVLSGCNSDKHHSTTIEWTSYGVPHITAKNYKDLGKGLGYVLAKDRLCNYADGFITVNSRRAQYLGAGDEQSNIDSDFAYYHLKLQEVASTTFENLDPSVQDLMKGFAIGYNDWLVKNPSYYQECNSYADQIDHLDVYKLSLSLNYWPFIENYFSVLANASPTQTQSAETLFNKSDTWSEKFKGSNGWALGKEMTQSGGGMVLSNTHLSHTAKYAWYEAHLTIPNKLNVYGGILPGFVTPALGFNDSFAWTHTWTASVPGSIYLLTQVNNDPLTYQYGDEFKTLTSNTYQIHVLQPNGNTEIVERTLYRSHYGPIVLFNNDGTMLAAKDAPSLRTNQADYWLKLAQSKSIEDAVKLNKQGYRTGSQNIMMADKSGQTFYADLAAVPHLSEQAWNIIENTPMLNEHNGVLLDGANPVFEWTNYVPFENIPKRYSSEYVQNANEPAWLVNLANPITEYVPLYGDVERAQSTRTRLSLDLLEEFKQLGGGVSLADLQQVMFEHRLFLAELVNDDLVSLCLANPEVYFSPIEQTVDISKTCDVLNHWDKTANIDSVGTHLFREYAFSVYESLSENDCNEMSCWQIPFSEDDPIHTPRGLYSSEITNTMHLEALAYATLVVQQAGIALDAPLKELQALSKGNSKQVAAGGYGDITGSFSVLGVEEVSGEDYVSYSGLTQQGYALNSGDGFIFAAELSNSGVKAKTMLLYSQSNDVDSPHYFDQASLLPKQEYKEVKFTSEAIKADPNYKKEKLKIN
ncbi:penicillin acylase family protein [Thalassotalea marina]|uniref:Aculeacin A acylase n=1 Tax=Thalassotalea marina TaxID=1673741 RepID=A0A919BC83_9GAMM|nr:penicillin acylase family protein [Thalassotalea marina]GHF79652.1 aculeacin A acylase [Thalassotalea marina]